MSLARVAAAAVCIAFPHPAWADLFPAKPVRLIVPAQPGTPIDTLARLSAAKLAEGWGQPVVVENHAGASGAIGARHGARAAPDGHALLFSTEIPLTMLPAAMKDLGYDPRADFRPIAGLARSMNALFVNSALGARSLADLVALARSQPGKLSYASPGVGTPAHFAGELFNAAAQIELVHVPYKGAASAMAAAVAGDVALMIGPVPQGLPHVRAGRLLALGVTGAEPTPLLPEARPLAEQGFPALVVYTWYVVVAPARISEAVASQVRTGLRRVLEDQVLLAKLGATGITPAWLGPAELARTLNEDLARWRELARRARIPLQ